MAPDDTAGSGEPKERILQAAIDLFSQKGFAATGVREIARQAGVNLAMINYYYGSKHNVLKAIIASAFEQFSEVVHESLVASTQLPLEERIRTYVRKVIDVGRKNQKALRVMLAELPFDVPEIAEFKATRIREVLLPMVRTFIEEFTGQANPGLRPELIGPAVHGMIMFHFLTAPVFSRAIGATLDDPFYEEYAQQLGDLVLYGLVGQRPKDR